MSKPKIRAWGNGKVQEQIFRINLSKFELSLFKDISAKKPMVKQPPKRGLK